MATTCPIGFDVAGLRAQVLATYDRVARDEEDRARGGSRKELSPPGLGFLARQREKAHRGARFHGVREDVGECAEVRFADRQLQALDHYQYFG